jgi:hypothetical protein
MTNKERQTMKKEYVRPTTEAVEVKLTSLMAESAGSPTAGLSIEEEVETDLIEVRALFNIWDDDEEEEW